MRPRSSSARWTALWLAFALAVGGSAQAQRVEGDIARADGAYDAEVPVRNQGVAEPGQEPFGAASGLPADLMQQRETLELVRAYNRIQDPAIRKRVFDLIKAMTPAD